ncbi:MAG: Ig-like domain-containing protein, partial [Actinobacteria bacterium]|nr:Ig-like domain-containing protein [Actinomycetota bacterium]
GITVTLNETGANTGVFTGKATFRTGASSGSSLRVSENDLLTLTYGEPTFSGGNADRTATALMNTNGSIGLNLGKYNLADRPIITVSDPDLNTDPSSPQTVAVNLKSTSDATGVAVRLTETANNTGIFTGTAGLTSANSSGSTLRVAQGDILTGTYSETTAFSVSPDVARTATAKMNTNGTATLDKARYTAADEPTLTVTDTDANTDPATAQVVSVNFKSTSDETGVSVPLTETGINTGVFTGKAGFTTGLSSGTNLRVKAGDTVTQTYSETTAFEGPTASRVATAAMVTDDATATLDKLRYNRTDTAVQTVKDADRNTDPASAQTLTAVLKSTTDGAGITLTLTETGVDTGIFQGASSFSTAPSSGTVLRAGSGDTITLTYSEVTFAGTSTDRTATATMTTNGAVAFDAANYQLTATPTVTVTDADLDTNSAMAETVPVVLKSTSDATGVDLTLTETGPSTGIFRGTASFTTGSSSGTALKVAAGDTVTAAYAETTTFEGPAATRTATAKMVTNATAGLDKLRYAISDRPVLTVTDAALNTNSGTAQTVSVNLKSTSEAAGISVDLTETGPSTGIFTNSAVTFSTTASLDATDQLKVAQGDALTLTYVEAETFEGAAADRTASATIYIDSATAGLGQTRYSVSEAPVLTVTDNDANTDVTTPQTVSVNFKSSTHISGVTVTLTETGPDTGVFSGAASLSTAASSGTKLQVAPGATVTATYNEPNASGTGTTARAATATMAINGGVAFNGGSYQLTGTPTVTVTDADLNTDSATAQTVPVVLRSTSDATGVTLTLTETGPSTGIFSGTSSFTTGPSSGTALKVAAGDTLTAAYAETTTFEGPAATRTASTTMATNGTAGLDKLRYVISDGAVLTVSDRDLDTNATTAQTVSVKVASTSDATGLTVTLTETGVNTGIFRGTATFTTGPSSANALKVAQGDSVTLTYAETGTFEGPAANRTATATIYRDSATAGLGQTRYSVSEAPVLTVTDNDANTDVTTPQTVSVNFKSSTHISGVTVTLTETGPDTGVFSGAASLSTAASSGTKLQVAPGATVTATYNEPNASGTGTTARAASALMNTDGSAGLDKASYTLTDRPTVTVTDPDLNTNSATTQTVPVVLRSSSDATGVTLTLTETGASTGIFSGTASFTTGPSSGTALKAAAGDSVTATYAETTPFTGTSPVNRTATAAVAQPATATSLSLSPANASRNVGDAHTVSAVVRDQNGNGMSGLTIRFAVTGANSAAGSAATGVDGSAAFSYHGANAGSDTVTAFADVDRNGTRAATEPTTSAAVTWVAPATPPPPAPRQGYSLVGEDGSLYAFGSAQNLGDMRGTKLNAPIIGVAYTPGGKGYWLVAKDGGIFSFGDAGFVGSMGGKGLNSPVIGMAATPTGKGYWLFAADGGIFSFGDADFFGSMGDKKLNAPVVNMEPTASGGGYWLVGADGGIFSFGNAKFFGSMGDQHVNQPVFDMTSTDTDQGYWLVARDGGIFSFGDAEAKFYGSAVDAVPTPRRVIGMDATPGSRGYWIAGADGKVYRFGDAQDLGDRYLAGNPAPMVAFAAVPA